MTLVNGSPKFRTVVQAWDLDTYRCVAMARFAGLSGFAWNQEEEHENLVVLGKPKYVGFSSTRSLGTEFVQWCRNCNSVAAAETCGSTSAGGFWL